MNKVQTGRRLTWLSRVGAGACVPLVALSVIGCGTEQDGGDPIESRTAPLWLWSGATLWPGGVVPVCWTSAAWNDASMAAVRTRVRRQANASWPMVANIEFTGWQECPTDTSGMVAIRFLASGASNAGGTGFNAAGLQMALGPTVTRANPRPGVVAHEFGHVLGFTHEMARADFVDDTTGACAENNVTGSGQNTPADRRSIMAATYCFEGGELSLWDAVGARTAYGTRTFAAYPLITAWHAGRGDHATVGTRASIADVNAAGYAWAYPEGWVFNNQIPGTTEMATYFHAGRGDYIGAATTATRQAAIAAGYARVRGEAYVFTSSQPGTVPLDLYWSAARQDNMLLSTDEARANAVAAGYTFVRTEAHIARERPYSVGWHYWSAARGDNLITAENTPLASDADAAAYQFVGFDGAFWRNQYTGTVALQNYWHGTRQDHFALGTTASRSAAQAAGYSLLGTEGFVYSSEQLGTVEYASYWHAGREDHMTSLVRPGGYTRVRREGFGLPLEN